AIALLLLITTMGFTVSGHYCGDRLVKVAFNAEAESCCDMENGCCHTETEHFQLENDFITSGVLYDLQGSGPEMAYPLAVISLPADQGITISLKNNYSEHPPPPELQTLLSLLQSYLT
ncbi:MAG: hypothetical protein JSV24_05300, partial [Bacteroidales bacterium]